jgi:malonyl-CoA O-methyltransferase
VNRFLPPQAWLQTVAANRQLSLCVELRPYRMQYRRVSELLHELKTLGAHNVNKHRQPGLTSRRALQGMIAAYEGWRENGLLPASYDVIFGVLEKP